MNPSQSLIVIFEELKPYIGEVLSGGRIGKRLSREELAERLRNNFNLTGVDAEFIESVENSTQDISFEEFEKICEAMGFSVEQVLKVAQLVDQIPPEDRRKELENEIDYELWRRKGKDI